MVYIHQNYTHHLDGKVPWLPDRSWDSWRAVHKQAKISLAHLETSLYGTRKRKRVSMRNINVHSMYIYTDMTHWHTHTCNTHLPHAHNTHSKHTPQLSPTRRNPTHTKVFTLVTTTCWPIRTLVGALRSTSWGKREISQ